jgi:hypothetical protein
MSVTVPTVIRCRVMGIVEDLLTNPGLYIGKDTVVGSDLVGAARIIVSALPGRAGVSLDTMRSSMDSRRGPYSDMSSTP